MDSDDDDFEEAHLSRHADARRRDESDDEAEAELLSQLISSQQTGGDCSQNADAAYAVLESHAQQAELDAAAAMDPVARANRAFWAVRSEVEPAFGQPIPSTQRYAVDSGRARMLAELPRGSAVRSLAERHLAVRSFFRRGHPPVECCHLWPQGVHVVQGDDGVRRTGAAATVGEHR